MMLLPAAAGLSFRRKKCEVFMIEPGPQGGRVQSIALFRGSGEEVEPILFTDLKPVVWNRVVEYFGESMPLPLYQAILAVRTALGRWGDAAMVGRLLSRSSLIDTTFFDPQQHQELTVPQRGVGCLVALLVGCYGQSPTSQTYSVALDLVAAVRQR